jgi:hypothetical protein
MKIKNKGTSTKDLSDVQQNSELPWASGSILPLFRIYLRMHEDIR